MTSNGKSQLKESGWRPLRGIREMAWRETVETLTVSLRDKPMKTAVIRLLLAVLLLFGSSQCAGNEQGRLSESSPPQENIRTQPEEPTDPQAIRGILRRYLNAPTSPYCQEINPVLRQGDRILPYSIEAAVANNGKNWRVYGLLGHILGHCSEDARRNVALKLLEVLTDEDSSIDLADGVLIMIGSLGKPGLVIESGLIEFRQSRPDLGRRTNDALIGIGSTQCGNIYAERLANKPSESLLFGVAAHGAHARDAGPEVMKLLDHPNRDLRLAAARTLGFIGYIEAVPALIDLLDDPIDVRVSWVAAESLGRLGARSAVDALTETAANHWHQAVRDTAQSALEHIASAKPYESRWRFNDSFSFEYFAYNYWRMKSPGTKNVDFVQEPPESKLYKSTSPVKMQELSYQSEIIGIGSGDEEEQRAAKEKGTIIVVRDDGLIEYRTPIQQVPDVALRVENGWLVGSDRGEWGGELVFVADDGQQTYVRKENVDDLFKLGEKYIAVTGLSHLSSNYGHVYEIKSVESGRWSCELWRILPGAPKSCGKLPSGEVFISTSGGGDIILSQDGTFRMAP